MTLRLETFTINLYTISYQQTFFFWLRYGLHNLISITSVMKPQTQCYTIFGYAPTVDIVWQQVKVLLEIYI